MSYATLQDLVDRFGLAELIQRTDEEGTGEPDTTKIARALVAADTLIDGYLMGRYALPIAGTVPPLLVDIACDVARYKLYTIDVPELVRRNYEDAVKRLADIQAGRITLAIAGVEPDHANPSNAEVRFSAPDRIFSREKLRGF